MKRACENCEYGVEICEDGYFDADAAQTGVFCHRYPPREQSIQKDGKTVQLRYAWPIVEKKEWCGEYKAKD